MCSDEDTGETNVQGRGHRGDKCTGQRTPGRQMTGRRTPGRQIYRAEDTGETNVSR